MAIGAHQDDIEFMAYHGIQTCYLKKDFWFGGVTCTDGAGSARSGKYAHVTNDQMMFIRAEEQRTAAKIGQYSFMHQLAFTSSHIKLKETRNDCTVKLLEILAKA